VVRVLRDSGLRNVSELMVAFDALAGSAIQKAAAAVPPWRAEAATLAGPDAAEEFFRMHRIQGALNFRWRSRLKNGWSHWPFRAGLSDRR
jgi:hypothetical protein